MVESAAFYLKREKSMASILIVDDQPQQHLIAYLEDDHEIKLASDGLEGLKLLETNYFDIVISDIYMPNMGGIDFLKEVRKIKPEQIFIFMTSMPDLNTAREAIRNGAFDYVAKDRLLAEITIAIARASERIELKRDVNYLHQAIHDKFAFDRIIGKSPQMEAVFTIIKKVLFNDSTILILGDTGTGKEMVAKSIHFNGKRAKKRYVAVNCAAISANLLESELFGHEKGAFTGAATSKKGLFEEADGGTIFLDEISEMPIELQSKLLRVLQEREVQRVGSTRPTKIDIRVIAASNRDIRVEVEKGTFRADLYYRLNVVPVELPLLKDRTGDVACLSSYFMALCCERNNVPLKKISPEAISVLEDYHWPGNVRELENVIERAVSLREEQLLEPSAFAYLKTAGRISTEGDESLSSSALSEEPGTESASNNAESPVSLADAEKNHIMEVLEQCNDNKAQAAKILDIDYSTLLRKLKRF
jgi:DNA-binding NtrC family response regulator